MMQHATRIVLLMAAAAALLGWELYHTEASFRRRAPLHPPGRALRARVVEGGGHAGRSTIRSIRSGSPPRTGCSAGPDRPRGSTRPSGSAAPSAVLLVIPTYLLSSRALRAAGGLAGVRARPGQPDRRLRRGQRAVGEHVLALVDLRTLGRRSLLPRGAVPLAAAGDRLRRAGVSHPSRGDAAPRGDRPGALLLLPILPATRINWPRWWRAIAFLGVGFVLLAGPYVAIKGGLGTKPGIARVLGLAPRSDPMGLERERPLPAESDDRARPTASPRSGWSRRFGESVTPPLFVFGVFGVALSLYQGTGSAPGCCCRSCWLPRPSGLVRLHATGGYLTVRHGLIPGMILTIAAAHGLTWLMGKASIPGRWLGWPQERLRPGPAVWAALIAGLVVYPNLHGLGPRNAGSVFGLRRRPADGSPGTRPSPSACSTSPTGRSSSASGPATLRPRL